MNIYTIEQNLDKYKYVVPVSDSAAEKLLGVNDGKKKTRWKPLKMEVDSSCKRTKAGDFWHFGGPPLIVSDKARLSLLPLIGDHAEFLSVTVVGFDLYIVNVLTVIDCIDKVASGWDEDEFEFEGPEFRCERIGNIPIFAWSENPMLVYVQESVRSLSEVSGLEGALFKKVWSQ